MNVTKIDEMAKFHPKSSKDKHPGEMHSQKSSTCSASYDDMTKILEGFHSTLTEIQKRMGNIEKAQSSIEDIKRDIYEPDGIEERLRIVGDETGENTSQLTELRRNNKYLQDEVDLLRNVVIRMDRRMEEIAEEVVHLRGRSMRDNILIHGFSQFPNEDLYRSIPEALKKYLGVNVKFSIVHRNGKPRPGGKAVSITAKLVDRSQREEILKAQRTRKNSGTNIPFYITAQEPHEIAEERKRLYNVSDKFRKRGINTKIIKNQLHMPNGKIYEDAVRPISNADILQVSPEEQMVLEEVPTVSSECSETRGHYMFATAGQVKSEADVNNVYKKVCLLKDAASSNHRILVYRYRNGNDDYDGYYDDGDHGMGRRILKHMKDCNIVDMAIVITRWNGPSHIGYERFKIAEKLVNDVSQRYSEAT